MIPSLLQDFVRLFYPSLCVLCQEDLLATEEHLCMTCRLDLPYTNFHKHKENALDSKFKGRFDYEQISSLLYFNTSGRVHDLLHEIKYRNNQELAITMGRMMGEQLKDVFPDVDCIIPVPLHKRRLAERGYNQSALLAQGMAECLGLPIELNAVKRIKYTSTQTHKTRAERIENMENAFKWRAISNRKILLLDDVITTGSTIESLVSTMPQANNSIHIISLATAIES